MSIPAVATMRHMACTSGLITIIISPPSNSYKCAIMYVYNAVYIEGKVCTINPFETEPVIFRLGRYSSERSLIVIRIHVHWSLYFMLLGFYVYEFHDNQAKIWIICFPKSFLSLSCKLCKQDKNRDTHCNKNCNLHLNTLIPLSYLGPLSYYAIHHLLKVTLQNEMNSPITLTMSTW